MSDVSGNGGHVAWWNWPAQEVSTDGVVVKLESGEQYMRHIEISDLGEALIVWFSLHDVCDAADLETSNNCENALDSVVQMAMGLIKPERNN